MLTHRTLPARRRARLECSSVQRTFAATVALLLAGSLPAQRLFDEIVRREFPDVVGYTNALALGDVDGDGDLDLWFGRSGQDLLCLNDGSGRYPGASAARIPADTSNTMGFALGDFDADGDVDVVRALHGQNTLWLNDGTGTYTDVTSLRMPTHIGNMSSVVAADVDGDGDLDLVCGNLSAGLARLFLNDGTARFTDATAGRLPTDPENSRAVAVVDVDQDGDPDIVLGSRGRDRLYVNDGTGRFADVTLTRMPADTSFTLSVAAGDVDGDGDVDLVFGDTAGMRVYSNDGAGGFTDATSGRLPPAAERAEAVALGDIDGDGDLDLIAGNYDATNRLYTNDGGGTFSASPGLPTDADDTFAVALGDVNGDGDLDLVTGNAGQNRLYVNNGSGAFRDTSTLQIGLPPELNRSFAVAAGDVDADGDVDLVFARALGERNRLYLNDGLGAYTDTTGSRMPAIYFPTYDAELGDVDGDGDLDLVFGVSGQNRLLLNDGTGTFTDATPARMPSSGGDDTRALALGDVDGDGDLDLVCANYLLNVGQQNRLWLNDGTGTFTDATATQLPFDADESSAVALGDVDGDGDLDLVFGNGGNTAQQNRLYLNDGTGTFRDATVGRMPIVDDISQAVTFGDVDRDGDLDLVFGNGSPIRSTVAPSRLYLNDGSGVFTLGSLSHTPDNAQAVALGDVDEDGDLDLVIANLGTNQLLLNEGRGNFTEVTATRLPVTSQSGTADVVMVDVDEDRDLDLVLAMDHRPDRVWVNLARQIHVPFLLQPGTDYPLEAYARHGRPAAADLVMPFVSAGRASIVLPPLGTVGIDPASAVPLPPFLVPQPAGVGAIHIAVPAQPALVGAAFYFQAVLLPFPRTPRLTNVLRDVGQ